MPDTPLLPARLDLAALRASPNALAPFYARFRVSERLPLTGHSHQAWPDRAERGLLRAFADAAELIDDKWGRAFEKADRIRRGFAGLLDEPGALIALGANTHDLLIRFLSALPLRERPRLVTTDGEFHTVDRQLRRLAEEGVEVVRVAARPGASVAERLMKALDDQTAAVIVSSVFFETAEIAENLGDVLSACQRVGAEMLVDAYHHLNAVPFSIRRERLEGAFVVGGGYKYCQLGEGNCFLRLPPQSQRLRPVATGWFAAFDHLASRDAQGPVPYGDGSARFAGATYDPTSHYRGAEVFDFFEEMRLTPDFLRAVSLHQLGLARRLFDALDLNPQLIDRDRSTPPEKLGGFLALRTPRAGEFHQGLRERGVLTDYRGDVLRLGPAPYLSDAQLETAMGLLGETARAMDFTHKSLAC